jgi:hypothetical protein
MLLVVVVMVPHQLVVVVVVVEWKLHCCRRCLFPPFVDCRHGRCGGASEGFAW